MMRLRISPVAAAGVVALILLNAACAFWIVGVSGEGGSVEVSFVAWNPDAKASLAGDAGLTAANAYPESLARPIFFRDRRPYVPPPPAPPAPAPVQVQPVQVVAPPPPMIKPDLIVSGIALVGNTRQAYLGAPSNTNGAWVKEGEDLMGWRVSGISSEGVTIS